MSRCIDTAHRFAHILNGVGEEFADKHGDGIFRRVGVEAVERVGASHIVQRA